MTDTDRSDDDLRSTFQVQRDLEVSSAPSFDRVRRGRVGRRPVVRPWLIPVVAAATIAVLLALRLTRPGGRPTPLFEFRPGDLRTPTDFLLDVAGSEFLNTVPKLGQLNGWYPLPESPKRGRETRSSRL